MTTRLDDRLGGEPVIDHGKGRTSSGHVLKAIHSEVLLQRDGPHRENYIGANEPARWRPPACDLIDRETKVFTC
jgi:hypothetical protein